MKKVFILLLFPFYAFSQEAELSGVVTYFFNHSQGNKPDIGAKVYLIDSSLNPTFDFQSFNNFMYGRFYRNIYFSYLENESTYKKIINENKNKKGYKEFNEEGKIKAEKARKMADEQYVQMTYYGVETQEKFDSLDKKCLYTIYKIDQNNPQLKVVNSTGSFSFKLKSGTYYILVISGNRKNINMTESTGKIYCEKIVIKENTNKDFSYNFELY